MAAGFPAAIQWVDYSSALIQRLLDQLCDEVLLLQVIFSRYSFSRSRVLRRFSPQESVLSAYRFLLQSVL